VARARDRGPRRLLGLEDGVRHPRPGGDLSAVALVPARSGSERVPGKNLHPLAGHPLIAYAIAGAHEAGIFDAVVVSTDSEAIAEVARRYGAETPALRPPELATSTSPDVEWILHMLDVLERGGRSYELFSILRPTSPFRTGATIRRGWDQLIGLGDRADSIRAVERARQHPGKMWVLEGELMRPLLDQPAEGTPTYSTQTKALPQVWVQNSSLEIAWTRVVRGEPPEIAGRRIAPFFTEEAEGFSIDYPGDLERAEALLAAGAVLPAVVPAAV
jgi:CMP-N,N'-diacetyllegionaminic acid synthase